MRTRDVTAVISTHEPGSELLDLVGDLLPVVGSVRIVDSGSAEGALGSVTERHPGLVITRLGSNRGPCATRNTGLREAETPFVLLVDDDMRVAPGAVAGMLDVLEGDTGLAAVGPVILRAGEDSAVQYAGGLWNYAGLTHLLDAPDPSRGETRAVDVLTAGCMLVRREEVLEAGGFDEGLFFLMEDAELSLRLRFLGWRLALVPAARAWNAGGSERLSLGGARHPPDRLRLHARNRPLVMLGLYDAWTLLVLLPGLLLLDAAWLAFCCLQLRPLAFLRGRLQTFGALPALLERRRRFLLRKQVRGRDLLGAAPVSLTPEARGTPLVAALTRLLDHCLRFYWRIARGVLQ